MTRHPQQEPSAVGLIVFMVLASVAVAGLVVLWFAGVRL